MECQNSRDIIADFEDCKARFGYDYVMEHSYDFYIALCKFQLNEFSEAEDILVREVDMQVKEKGEDWLNPMDLFYLGIAKFEQGKYEEASTVFNRTLKLYPKFSEAMYYRAVCHKKSGSEEIGDKMLKEAISFGKQGYTITDDNVVYERYPYQIVWELE